MKKSSSILVFIGLLFLSASDVGAVVSSPPTIKLPPGTTTVTATVGQLAAAVQAAVKADPRQASAIVAQALAQVKSDSQKAAAVIGAVIPLVPASSLPAIVYAAAKANPRVAPAVAATAAAGAPQLAIAITRAAAAGAPSRIEEISLAVSKVVPSIPAEEIVNAAKTAATMSLQGVPLPAILGTNPGGNSVNPANTTGGEVSES